MNRIIFLFLVFMNTAWAVGKFKQPVDTILWGRGVGSLVSFLHDLGLASNPQTEYSDNKVYFKNAKTLKFGSTSTAEDDCIMFDQTTTVSFPSEASYPQICFNKSSGLFKYTYNGSTFTPFSSGGGGTTSPLSTKGDLWGYSTLNARVPVGSNGFPLVASSPATLGVSYENPQKSFFQKKLTGLDCSAPLGTGTDGGTYNSPTTSGCTGAVEFSFENKLQVDSSSRTSGQFAVTFYPDLAGGITRYYEVCYDFSHFTDMNTWTLGQFFAINICAGNSACSTDGADKINVQFPQSLKQNNFSSKDYSPMHICTTFSDTGFTYAGGAPLTTTVNLVEMTQTSTGGSITSNKIHCTDASTDQGACRITIKEL